MLTMTTDVNEMRALLAIFAPSAFVNSDFPRKFKGWRRVYRQGTFDEVAFHIL
jgi:hypothetical protein